MERTTEKIALRVSILDAKELDDEIFGILKSQLSAISSLLPPGAVSRYEPEIEAIVKLYIWKVSVEKNFATFGQQLLSLKYSENSSLRNLRLYGLCTIGAVYLRERLHTLLQFVRDPKLVNSIQSAYDFTDVSLKLLNILSFLIFLRKGSSSSFVENFLSLDTVSVAKGSRSLGYAYMTRELIWHGFIEMLAFMIPLINYHAVKRRIRQMVFGSNQKANDLKTPCVVTPNTKCSICRDVPVVPHQMGCSHAFCYYCLSASRLADLKFECPDCGFSDPDPGALKPIIMNEHLKSFLS